MRELKVGIYKHFKSESMLYKVLGMAVHSETLEKYVVYMALYGESIGQMYIRPLEMFLEKVPEGKENPTGQVYRFEFVRD
jgi:hypothetical protein